MNSSPQNPNNHLSEESSPYLLQHADNPVNWYAWSDEAFEEARAKDKPVFVSIGYATCHWCHVMAHESFEDEEIANLMNEAFVNIKVDREERPDIDNTYMFICQMLTGRGGWPLNVLLTPNKRPFYAATYIPKDSRQGQPGMRQLIPSISKSWNEEREKITNSTAKIIDGFQKSISFESGDRIDEENVAQAVQQFQGQYDEQHGGLGSAPKFPASHNLMLLMRYASRTQDEQATKMVNHTLTSMRHGGLFDHIGYGFHRYSTGREWLVPHFEKMLYDQAMLMLAYTEGWQLTKNPLFKNTVDEIAEYILRKMQHPEGGFYSAEDADSEGVEGKFYVWSTAEIRSILDTPEAELAIEVFNFDEDGNYKDESTGQRTGKNIPHLTKSISELAEEREMSEEQLENKLSDIRDQLLSVRKQRIHPLLDDKILTNWNGLMLAALSKAGRETNNQEYIDAAKQCREFLSSTMITENGTLKHRFRDKDTAIDAHNDDYAFLIWGLLELYEATFDADYLESAVELQQQQINLFGDDQQGGFYFTSAQSGKILGRKKEIHDSAKPSGNSVAIMNLLRLGRITGKTEWEQKAEEAQQLFAGQIDKAPTAFGFMLQSAEFTAGAREVVICGPKDHSKTQQMLQLLNNHFLPNTVVLLKDPDDDDITDVVPFLEDFEMIGGQPTAYVCKNYSCDAPTNDVEELVNKL